MVPKTHQNIQSWGAIIGAALALAGVIFTAGSANTTLAAHTQVLDQHERRLTDDEHQMADLRVIVAQIKQASDDTNYTVHRIDGSPSPLAH